MNKKKAARTGMANYWSREVQTQRTTDISRGSHSSIQQTSQSMHARKIHMTGGRPPEKVTKTITDTHQGQCLSPPNNLEKPHNSQGVLGTVLRRILPQW